MRKLSKKFMALIEGFSIGLGMIIFIGPVFFLLLNSSLQFGSKAGFMVALGIIFSDILCVLLCFWGLLSVAITVKTQVWIGIFSAVLLVSLGLFYLFKKVSLPSELVVNSKALLSFFIKGFSVNFFNPFVFVVWASVFNLGKSKYPETSTLILFNLAVLLGILSTDVLKVFLAKKIIRFMTLKRMAIIFKVTGVILILFSIRIAWYVYHI